MDLHGEQRGGWIGVDLDGTLARYDGWVGPEHIGEPIPRMVNRVVAWLSDPTGPRVKIMTARVHPGKADADICRAAIQRWVAKHILPRLPISLREPFPYEVEVTHEKDYRMIELWDDRCVQVIPNTGVRADGKE